MLDLFTGRESYLPKTEGIKYAGSKLKILPYILDLTRKLQPKSIFDGFTGTTRVAQAFAQAGYAVIANDRAAWSETFGKCYLLNSHPSSHYVSMINYLNNLPPEDGWFTEHYGGFANGGVSVGSDGLKKPWQMHNTRKLDAIRTEIDRLGISDLERSVLLTSLIYALDEVDNTLGHFAAYLNEWSPRSYKTMKLSVPALFHSANQHRVISGDVFKILPEVAVDLAYFDPPYGSNNDKMPPSRVRYSAYYHVWTTICLNDKPQLFGKALRRADTSDSFAPSIFEEFRRGDSGRFIAVEAIEKLISNTNARHIILSYSSGGRATAEEINDVIARNGTLIEVAEINYKKNVMANMRWTSEWIRNAEEPNREFLFVIDKG